MPQRPRLRFATVLIVVLAAAIPITAAFVGLPAYLGGDGAVEHTNTLFSVPPERARLRAIGPTDDLEAGLQRAFDPAEDFQPVADPQPGYWLAEHGEPGQTFEQYVASEPHRPDQQRNRLYILPLGEFDPNHKPSLADLQLCAEAFFQMEVRVLPPVKLDDPALTNRINRHTGKRQYLTGDLLEMMRQQLPEDAYCMLGLTPEDLYPKEEWNFVFGMASLRDRVGVFSSARKGGSLTDNPPSAQQESLTMRRNCRTLLHETGHMFGMQHCIYFSCLMNGSNHLEEADSQPLHLCPVCLRKLHWNRGDPGFVTRRYRQLEQAYKTLGLDDEAAWIARREARIAGGNSSE